MGSISAPGLPALCVPSLSLTVSRILSRPASHYPFHWENPSGDPGDLEKSPPTSVLLWEAEADRGHLFPTLRCPSFLSLLRAPSTQAGNPGGGSSCRGLPCVGESDLDSDFGQHQRPKNLTTRSSRLGISDQECPTRSSGPRVQGLSVFCSLHSPPHLKV